MKQEHYMGKDFQVIEDRAGDIVIARARRAGEPVLLPRYPRAWLTPRGSAGVLRLGDGTALMSGTVMDGTLVSGGGGGIATRAVLVEPYTVDWVHDPGVSLYAASVTPGTPTIVAAEIDPATWTYIKATFTTGTGASVAGRRCVILGALVAGRLAYAEKVKYTGGGPDVYEAQPYPWVPVLNPATLPGYTLSEITDYYYNEREITEDTDL